MAELDLSDKKGLHPYYMLKEIDEQTNRHA